jgi:glycosyltransferase involved in cell wall biosynthesis
MKIVLYIHHGKGIGGAPISLFNLISKLDRNEFKPVVLFLYNSDAVKLAKEKNIEFIGPVNRSDFSHTKIWWYRWCHPHHFFRAVKDSLILYFGEAKNWIQKVKPDIVHLNTSSLLAWGIVAKRMDIPVVWHIREPLAPGYFGLRRFLVRKIIEKYATKIVPICQNDAAPWQGSEKLEVVYNAVDLEQFNQNIFCKKFRAKIEESEGVPIILYMGGVSKEKGTHIILESFKNVLKTIPSAKLVIAGYWGPPKKRLFSFLKSPSEKFYKQVTELAAELNDSLILLGPVTNVPEIMAAATCLVFPATVGHFARPVIEAGCMGLPVVASKLSPAEELTVDGETGFLVEPENITAWSKILIFLCQDKKLNKKIGNETMVWCRKNFSLEKQVELVETIYRKIEKP